MKNRRRLIGAGPSAAVRRAATVVLLGLVALTACGGNDDRGPSTGVGSATTSVVTSTFDETPSSVAAPTKQSDAPTTVVSPPGSDVVVRALVKVLSVYTNPYSGGGDQGFPIPKDTDVAVKCWVSGLVISTRLGDNPYWYQLNTSPWTGYYAHADAFTPTDALKAPGVPPC